MNVDISEIKIRKRIRKENGDIESLMESLTKHGLMNPIVINEKYELIAGFRRFTAAKSLGWETIPATVVQAKAKKTKIELELEENLQRLDFTDDEILEGIAALDRYKNPKGLRKIFLAIADFFAWFFDKKEAIKAEKKRKNAKLSLLAPSGFIFLVVSGILHKNEYISEVLLSIFNIMSFVIIVIGIFFFIRFCRGIERK